MTTQNRIKTVLTLVAIAVSAVQADTNNVVGGDITKAAGWDNGLPTSSNPAFIAVDGVINDDTWGFGRDTLITQIAGILDGGSKTMNFGAFNGTDGGGTWNMSGGTITVRAININATSNSTLNISGGALVLNHTGIDLGKGAHISASKAGSYLNISGTAVLDETNATKERNTGGNYDIASDWTGYWTCGVYSGDDWKNFIVDVDYFTVDGAAIDAATFDGLFVVSDDGKTLSMNLMNPHPANGETVTTANPLTLSWTNIDPNTPGDDVYVDVWFGTEPNELDPSYDITKIVPAGKNTTTVQVDASVEGTYYWQVNSYIYGAGLINEPNMIEGSLWSFNAVDDSPPSSVDAGVDMITWSGQAVSLDATVVDDGKSPLTYLWTTADPNDDVVFDPSAAVEDPTVTITKATANPSVVSLTLAVHDENNPTPVEDIMTIDVYDDACQAARIGLGLSDPTDFDESCITDLKDLAALLAKWLVDYALAAPIAKP